MLKTVLCLFGVTILGWITYRLIYLRRKKRQYRDALSMSFNNKEINIPDLKTRYSYAYPSFVLTFSSEEQLILAEKKGLIKQFENKIQEIHKDLKDFEADRAVYSTWKGRSYNIMTI